MPPMGTKGAQDAKDDEVAAGPAHFKKSVPREYLESVVVAVILALFIRTFVVQAFKIPTGSMETNLLIGDHLLVNKLVYSPSARERSRTRCCPRSRSSAGTWSSSSTPRTRARDFIKRVIGLPGETVEIRNKVVHIDGKPLDEPYVHFLRAAARPAGPRVRAYRGDERDNWGPKVVPAGHAVRAGRQPRQQPGQPFLGLPAHRPGEGPGAARVLVVRGVPRGVPSDRLAGVGARYRRRVRQDALEPLLPPDPLERRQATCRRRAARFASAAHHAGDIGAGRTGHLERDPGLLRQLQLLGRHGRAVPAPEVQQLGRRDHGAAGEEGAGAQARELHQRAHLQDPDDGLPPEDQLRLRPRAAGDPGLASARSPSTTTPTSR